MNVLKITQPLPTYKIITKVWQYFTQNFRYMAVDSILTTWIYTLSNLLIFSWGSTFIWTPVTQSLLSSPSVAPSQPATGLSSSSDMRERASFEIWPSERLSSKPFTSLLHSYSLSKYVPPTAMYNQAHSQATLGIK